MIMFMWQSTCSEHFLESEADQTSSFVASKQGSLLTFVNHQTVFVAATELRIFVTLCTEIAHAMTHPRYRFAA